MRTEPNKEERVYGIIKERSFEKTNKERKEYLSSRYALGYAELCDYLGLEPEDPCLYEQGQADLMRKNVQEKA